MSLLDVRDLTITYPGAGPVVRGATLTLAAGEGLALVGASGAGKSSIALALMGLLPPGAGVEGQILLDGVDVAHHTPAQRGGAARRMAVAFQDAGSALNPVLRVGRQVAEGSLSAGDRDDAFRDAGLDPPAIADRYPHELSGGQRQRVMLAMALASRPDVLIADEPTSGLDATLRVALLDRLAAIRQERSVAILLITHDLAAAQRVADRVMVLADGTVVESDATANVLARPVSAQARALVAAIPRLPETTA